MQEYSGLLDRMRSHGWRIVERHPASFCLPLPLRLRYPRLPLDLESFLAGIEVCVHPDNDQWILCQADYEGRSSVAFAWNEFELMSLVAAGNDAGLAAGIESFWTDHLPICMSVAGHYSYWAITVSSGDFGTVIQGSEPEFEKSTVIASSFSEFIDAIVPI